MKKLDILGKVFGKLTVMERSGSKSGYANYLCRCACGNTSEVTSRNLVNGNYQSCGCSRKESLRLLYDLTGSTAGNLFIVKRLDNGKYLCKCSCPDANEVEVSAGNLKKNTQSCGCVQRQRTSDAKRIRPYEAVYHGLQYRAEKRGIAVLMSYEDFTQFTQIKTCHYCGGEVVWHEYNGNNKGYNLDRKNNSLPYTKENCVVCCSRCNRSKGDRFSYDEWVCMTLALRHMKNNLASAVNGGV